MLLGEAGESSGSERRVRPSKGPKWMSPAWCDGIPSRTRSRSRSPSRRTRAPGGAGPTSDLAQLGRRTATRFGANQRAGGRLLRRMQERRSRPEGWHRGEARSRSRRRVRFDAWNDREGGLAVRMPASDGSARTDPAATQRLLGPASLRLRRTGNEAESFAPLERRSSVGRREKAAELGAPLCQSQAPVLPGRPRVPA
jgi:hypothetical protein